MTDVRRDLSEEKRKIEACPYNAHIYPFAASDGNAGQYGVIFAKIPVEIDESAQKMEVDVS